MESFEGIWDFEIEKIDTDIMDLKEKSRLKKLISDINLYTKSNDTERLTEIYTKIMLEDNVVKTMTKVSQDISFYNNFPELFETNLNDENFINCQQNSKYHKYGVFRHTLEAIKTVGTNRAIPYSDYEIKILKWTMFLHDIGKPATKQTSETGSDSFAGHEDLSAQMADVILDRFKFTVEEKNTILKLIKYHDKYINQGEITYDNMKFLANELGNNKKTFNLLLEVKEADARAKCDEVYETYKTVKQKYLEFMSTYFSYENNENENVISNSLEANTDSVSNKVDSFDDVTNEDYEELLLNTINRKNIDVYYQPMIDLKQKRVVAYEMFSRIDNPKSVPIVDLLNYSKKVSKFDKIQQVLMVNSISEFEKIESKEASCIFVNIDYDSYSKYINKPRIYDMMTRNKVVIEFKNYSEASDLEMTIKTIKQHGGYVCLDSFALSGMRLENLENIKPNYIKFDVAFLNNINVDSEKQKYLINVINYCMSRDIEVITVGIEDRGTLITLKNLGLTYVQGYLFAYPDKSIRLINHEVEKTIDSINNENSL